MQLSLVWTTAALVKADMFSSVYDAIQSHVNAASSYEVYFMLTAAVQVNLDWPVTQLTLFLYLFLNFGRQPLDTTRTSTADASSFNQTHLSRWRNV